MQIEKLLWFLKKLLNGRWVGFISLSPQTNWSLLIFFFFLTLNREFRRMFVFMVLSETCLLWDTFLTLFSGLTAVNFTIFLSAFIVDVLKLREKQKVALVTSFSFFGTVRDQRDFFLCGVFLKNLISLLKSNTNDRRVWKWTADQVGVFASFISLTTNHTCFFSSC